MPQSASSQSIAPPSVFTALTGSGLTSLGNHLSNDQPWTTSYEFLLHGYIVNAGSEVAQITSQCDKFSMMGFVRLETSTAVFNGILSEICLKSDKSWEILPGRHKFNRTVEITVDGYYEDLINGTYLFSVGFNTNRIGLEWIVTDEGTQKKEVVELEDPSLADYSHLKIVKNGISKLQTSIPIDTTNLTSYILTTGNTNPSYEISISTQGSLKVNVFLNIFIFICLVHIYLRRMRR